MLRLVFGLWALPVAAQTVTVAPGSVTVQMTPQEFRGHRVARGTAVAGGEGRPVSGVQVTQAGVGHSAAVQTAGGNRVVVRQQGAGHAATVTQAGTAQGALVIQTGTGAVVDLVQVQDRDGVVILQHGWEPRR